MVIETHADGLREQKSLFGVRTGADDRGEVEALAHPTSSFNSASEQGSQTLPSAGSCDDRGTQEPKDFWRRQFQNEPTRRQIQYDWAFGVIIPLICMLADPIIFKGSGLSHGVPTLGFAKPFAYLLSFSSIVMMVGWLSLGKRLGRVGTPIAGLFFAGSAISFAVGILILPISIIGMFFLIGFLGYTPLISAIVYFRNGLRAFRSAGRFGERKTRLYVAVLTGVFCLVVPYVVNVQISQCLEEMRNGDVATIYANAEKLRFVAPIVDFHAVAGKYCAAPNNAEHMALADVYSRFTGESLEDADYPICNDF